MAHIMACACSLIYWRVVARKCGVDGMATYQQRWRLSYVKAWRWRQQRALGNNGWRRGVAARLMAPSGGIIDNGKRNGNIVA